MTTALAAAPASAEEGPIAEVSGGYSFVRTYTNLPAGWFVEAGWPVTGWLTMFGELASNRHAQDVGGPRAYRTDLSLRSALVGGRISRPFGESLKAFWRASVGRTWSGNHTYETAPAPSDPFVFDVAVTIAAPAVHVGTGFDTRLGSGVWVRSAMDYRRTFRRRVQTLRLPNTNDIRLTVGLVVALGSR